MAIAAALIASIAGSFLFAFSLSILAPGDGGWEASASAAGPIAFAATITSLLCGTPLLLLIGVPAAWQWLDRILAQPKLAMLTGGFTGMLIGALAALVLQFTNMFLLAAMIVGGAYGVTWMGLLQSSGMRHPSPLSEADDANG